jgi:malonyl-CoA O-methyltransferase
VLSWFNKQRGIDPKVTWLESDLSETGLAPESLDLVWSNLALHWHPAPHDVLAEWGRILKLNGLVFFSCFGPATMQELRSALTTAGLQTATPRFVDMHDFGDLLIEKGFADPVMDQEVLTLTYPNAEKLLADVRALGGNPALGRKAGLVGKAWRNKLINALESQRAADGTIHLTIEVAYGHAWRIGTLRTTPGETRISVSTIQRKPTGSR